jgi:hypothetical protein
MRLSTWQRLRRKREPRPEAGVGQKGTDGVGEGLDEARDLAREAEDAIRSGQKEV